MPIHTSDIILKAKGGEFRAYLAEPENGGPGILLLHAWWGLKPFFKQTCDRLAEQGFIVLAPDLREGQIARTIDEAEQLNQKSNSRRTGEIVTAVEDYLLGLPGRKSDRIGVIGFSLGAAWALSVAAEMPEKVAATVLFYGSGDEDLAKVRSKILGHFSEVDEWESYDQTQAAEQKMRAAGIDVKFHIYPGKAHWFVEEDRPEYDAAAARLAWDRTSHFLKQNLPA